MRAAPFVLSTLLATALAPLATALTDPQPSNEQWVETYLDVRQPDLETLDVRALVVLRKFVVQGTPYTSSDDIANAYQQLLEADTFALQNGQEGGRAQKFVDDMANDSAATLRETLLASFGEDANVTVEPGLVDTLTLAAPEGDPHEPGVRMLVDARVQRPVSALGAGDLSLAAVVAALRAGATLSTDLSLSAKPGHDVSFTLHPPDAPDGLAYGDVGPPEVATDEGGDIVVRLDNAAGTVAMARELSFTLSVPGAVEAAPTAEDIRLSADLAVLSLGAGEPDVPMRVVVTADVRAVDVPGRFGASALPASVRLGFVSDAGIRELHAAGAFDADAVAAAEASLRETFAASLADALPGASVASASDLAATPVRFTFVAEGKRAGPDGAKDADVALRIGANVTFELPAVESTLGPVALTVRPPPGASFVAATEGARVEPDGAVRVAPGDAAARASVTLRGSDAPVFAATDEGRLTRVRVLIDLRDLDVSLLDAAGGDLGALVGSVNVTLELGVLAVPAELRDALPGALQLDHLSSDGIRLLRERGVLAEDDLADFERRFLENLTTQLSDALGVPVTATGGIDRATLDPALVGTDVSGERPVVLQAGAEFVRPLSGAPSSSAAIALYSHTQTFALPRVRGLETEYVIVLPKGLAVTALEADGATAERDATDGRDRVRIAPTEERSTATLTIAVTPTFVLAKFWPVVLFAVLLLVLAVGSVVALVRLRRRRRRAA